MDSYSLIIWNKTNKTWDVVQVKNEVRLTVGQFKSHDKAALRQELLNNKRKEDFSAYKSRNFNDRPTESSENQGNP